MSSASGGCYSSFSSIRSGSGGGGGGGGGGKSRIRFQGIAE
jgi:hypothetical protein